MPRKADGEVLIISRIDNSKAQKDLDKLTESIEEQEKTIAKMEKKGCFLLRSSTKKRPNSKN